MTPALNRTHVTRILANPLILTTPLRLAGLTAKLALTLYMGRYLSLQDMGTYGLVLGAVMILTVTLGFRIDHVVSRELVRVAPLVALVKMRDESLFYIANYIGAVVIGLAIVHSGMTGISPRLLIYIFALTITDSYFNLTYINMNAMERSLIANVLYFIPGGLWCIIVILLGIVRPEFRTLDAVLISWVIGDIIFITASFSTWRRLPWRELREKKVNWKWIGDGVSKSFLIWLGTIGLMAGSYVDRFVLAHFLTFAEVGVATFYFSFVNTMLTLVQAGILVFAAPRLISLHRDGDEPEFWNEFRRTAWHVALFAGLIALGVSAAVPLIGKFFQRPQLVENAPLLWLMAAGMWIRCNAESLFQVLFARHQDRAIWAGNLLYVIPALVCNALLVALVGLIGAGFGSIISSLFLLLWRGWHVRKPYLRLG